MPHSPSAPAATYFGTGPQPRLTTPSQRLVLRPFVPDDAPAVQDLLSDAQIAAGTLRIPHPYPAGAAAAWIATLAPKWAEGRFAAWALTDAASDVVRGAISLRVTPAHRRAEVGYWVARASWGQGYATDAVRAIIAYGFDRLKLHRIEGHCYAENPASARVMQRAGMRHEGRVRGAVFRNGVARDLELYGIIQTDPRG
jgi:[ribosomal protein S5]-alanine N-acetyltransferase